MSFALTAPPPGAVGARFIFVCRAGNLKGFQATDTVNKIWGLLVSRLYVNVVIQFSIEVWRWFVVVCSSETEYLNRSLANKRQEELNYVRFDHPLYNLFTANISVN